MKLDALMELAGSLGDVLPLEILSESDRVELVSHMGVRRFHQDEVVYHQGDPAAHVFVVYSGVVKVLVLDENGREVLLSLLGRGEFFGELALFEDLPRESGVVAVVPTTVLQIDRDGCLRVLARNPRARDYMFKRLASTIHVLSDKLQGMVFLDVPSRLAKYLLELKATGSDLPITQDDLAAAVGSTRFTVNKLLADFQRRGLIKVDRRRVEIIDEAQLLGEIRP